MRTTRSQKVTKLPEEALMASKDVANPEPSPLEVFAARRAAIDAEAAMSGNSLEDFIQAKIGAILTADSFEQINALMTQTGLTAARDLIGRTFEILDFATKESAQAYRNAANPEKFSALEKFAIVKGVDVSTGEEFIIDGGGDQFVAGIVAMRDLYDFPFTGTLLAQTTSSGRELQYWRFMDPKRPAAR